MNRNDLIRYAILYEGNYHKIAMAIEKNEEPVLFPIQQAITIYDDAYPDSLRSLRYPPWVLFYEGNLKLLETNMVTIVGSRQVSDYGKSITQSIASILSSKYTLVSGLAKGVDGIVHTIGIEQGHTIGVIGSGLGMQYPKCNANLYKKMAKDHLILSEYPYTTGVRREHFPWRNRILASLGKVTIVTQAAVKSGTMLTVNEAMALSKDVYVVPYPLEENHISGCNKLINDGALILYEKQQLYDL